MKPAKNSSSTKLEKYVKYIENSEQYENLKKKGLVIVDYNTAWCGPCRKFAPVFEQIASMNQGITFLSVDSELIEHSDCQSIRSVPTFRVFFNGKLKREFVGADKERLIKYIERYRIQIFINGNPQKYFNKEIIKNINKYMESNNEQEEQEQEQEQEEQEQEQEEQEEQEQEQEEQEQEEQEQEQELVEIDK